jgi:hypothetical protein
LVRKGPLEPDGCNTAQKLNHFESMPSRTIEKIETIFHFLDRDGVFLCVMLDNELLKVEESPFVSNFLSNLYKRLPSVLGR